MRHRNSWTRRMLLTGAAATGFCNSLLSLPTRIFGQGGGTGRHTRSRLFQIEIVNDGASTAPALIPTDWFGLNFKAGDIPAGDYFQLQSSKGLVQPFSSGGEAYHPDGSLLHANVRLKPTASTPGGRSQLLSVFNGGRPPGSAGGPALSGRSVTELYAQELQINATISKGSPQPPPGGNANWVAKVDAAHVIKTENWADGEAGLGLALWMDFFAADEAFNISGAAHGQLMCKLYVFLLNGLNSEFGGMHLCAAVVQPKYNHDIPAKNIVALSLLQYQSGSTKINWPLDMTPFPFRFESGGLWQTSGSFGSTCACITTALSGTNLKVSQLYFLIPPAMIGGSANQFGLTLQSNLATPITGSAGSGKLTPVIAVPTFCASFGINSNGDWIYLQGRTGTIPSSSIVPWRTKFDQMYFRNTKLIPPYNIAQYQGVANRGTIPDQGFKLPWVETSIGTITQALANVTGDGPDIWVISAHSAVDYFNQSRDSRNVVKFNAYARGKLAGAFLDKDSLTVLDLISPPGKSIYGFPYSASTKVDSYGAGNPTGFRSPPWPNDTCYIFESSMTRHMPDLCYYAYLTLGRPEFWDQLKTAANDPPIGVPIAMRNAKVVEVDYGNQLWIPETRSFAWALRDICAAAIVAPGKQDGTRPAPDGTNSVKYYRDWHMKVAKLQKDTMDPSINGSLASKFPYVSTARYWNFHNLADNSTLVEAAWQTSYLLQTLAFAYGVLGDANVKAWADDILANKLHKLTRMGPWAQFSYYERNLLYGTTSASRVISSDAEYGQWGMHKGGTNWTAAADPTHGTHFTMATIGPYTMHNGDGLFFNGADGHPSNLDPQGNYIVVNLVQMTPPPNPSYKFNLAQTSAPKTVLKPSNDGNAGLSMYFHPYTYPDEKTSGVSGNNTMQDSVRNWWFCYRYAKFVGLNVDSRQQNSAETILRTDNLIKFAGDYNNAKRCISDH